MIRFLAGLVALLPLTVSAQTLAEDYAAAHGTFVGTEDFGAEETFALSQSLIDGAEGRWVEGRIAAGTGPELDVDFLAEDCSAVGPNRVVADISRISPYSFEISQFLARDGVALIQRFDAVRGRTFNAVNDPVNAMVHQYGEPLPDEASRQQIILESRRVGLVQIYQPSPNILVILYTNGWTELYVRCPA